MSRTSKPLPARFPVGAKYVVEGRGSFVRRYVEFPGGRRVDLAPRKAATCTCAELRAISIVPAPQRRTKAPASAALF